MDPTPGRHNSLVTQSQAKTWVAHRHNTSKAPSAQAESAILFKEDSSCRVIFICISLPAFSGVKNIPRQQHFLALCFGQNVVGRFLKIPGESQGKGRKRESRYCWSQIPAAGCRTFCISYTHCTCRSGVKVNVEIFSVLLLKPIFSYS